jgi:hypothetical protein
MYVGVPRRALKECEQKRTHTQYSLLSGGSIHLAAPIPLNTPKLLRAVAIRFMALR